MRVLMLTWEYPPLIVGGLGRHVEALARELVAAGHHVQVVTRGEKDEPVDEVLDGVHVRRAAIDPIALDLTTESLLAWVQAMEHTLLRAALPLVAARSFDVVHAHDWLVAQSATTLARTAGSALVATVHATEAGRNQQWLPKPMNIAIHSVERWLAHGADAVITCSRAMRTEVATLFEIDAARVDVIPNGVDVSRWASARRTRHEGTRLVYIGRLEHAKGVHTLLDAVRTLRRTRPHLRLTVAGTGTYAYELHDRASRLRIARSVDWLGFAPDEDVLAALAQADVAVVPSLYEPFGIVALEAAAARVPVVVSDTGGLTDLVSDGVAAASFTPGDSRQLVAAITRLLDDPDAARRATTRASRVIRRDYTWAAVAAHTAEVYRRAVTGQPSRARNTAS